MHEIVTLQFGQQANYLGTHYWNTQVGKCLPILNPHGVGLTYATGILLHLRWAGRLSRRP